MLLLYIYSKTNFCIVKNSFLLRTLQLKFFIINYIRKKLSIVQPQDKKNFENILIKNFNQKCVAKTIGPIQYVLNY